MSFVAYYPRLDKICDAAFIRAIIGSTKKDAPSIIRATNLTEFFEQIEKEAGDLVNAIRHKLEEKLRSPAIKESIIAYKSSLNGQRKIQDKKELEKQQIIAEYKTQVRQRYTSISISNDDDDDDDTDDSISDDQTDGPGMTLNQFAILMQNAIADNAITFQLKPSDTISKPTLKIVNNQLRITIKFSPQLQKNMLVPKKVILNSPSSSSSSSNT